MINYLSRAQKIQSRIVEMGQITTQHAGKDDSGKAFFISSSNKIAEWMNDTGLETRIDNIGNVRGILRSKTPNAKTFVIGSQYNNDKNDAKFDGPLSILTGMDIAQNVIAQKIDLSFNLEIVAFSEKEDTRFNTSYLGSKALSGRFNNYILDKKDEKGNTLGDVLTSLNLDVSKIKEENIPADEWLGYLEIHTEQGLVLHNRKIPVSAVQALAGQKRVQIKFVGKPGHAGNVPMNVRVDALCAAAQFIVETEEYASPERRNLVATVGQINVEDAARNLIPHVVTCSLDIRSADPARLSKAYEALNKKCERICHKRNVYFEWKLLHETEPVICDEKLREMMNQSISKKKLEVVELVSGAGHDAAIISRVAPVAMLFLKYHKNNNFNSLGNVENKYIAVALEVSDNLIQLLNISEQKRLEKVTA
ncbi:MAG: hydantoinase/carbamoylase family amidase [Ginsengibacter sp.]